MTLRRVLLLATAYAALFFPMSPFATTRPTAVIPSLAASCSPERE